MDSESGFTMEEPSGEESPAPAAKANRRDARVTLLSDGRVRAWRTPDGAACISVKMGRRWEVMRVPGRDIRNWIMVAYLAEHRAALSGQAMAQAVALLEARALSSGEVRRVWRRWGWHDGRIYLALGGGDPEGERRVVEIAAEGWRVLAPEAMPDAVAFLYAGDALPLPEPERDDAKPADLRAFVNVEDDDALALLWAWLVCAVRPFAEGGSYPILLLHGEQGSGKSGASRALQALADPSTLTGRALPREERDLFITAANRHLLAFDNLSSIGDGFADCLCRIATGGGFSARALHTDGEEVIFSVVRPLLANGIPATLLSRPDLADRALALELKPLRERREEAELAADFARMRPGLLGLLCDGLSSALRNLAATKIADPPRMIDAAVWAEAAAPGLGLEPGRIAAAWRANRGASDRAALEVDDVAQAVVRLLDKVESLDILGEEVEADARTGRRYWKGSPQSLYARLSELAGERVTRGRLWPQNPSGMGTKLRRIAPGLRAVLGIEAAHGKGGSDGSRWWSVRRV
jgi:putative DNA primase/helicase